MAKTIVPFCIIALTIIAIIATSTVSALGNETNLTGTAQDTPAMSDATTAAPAGGAPDATTLQAQAALANTATLVSNTDACGGGTTCEALFTLEATGNKFLQRDHDIFITFEDQHEQLLPSIPFTYDYEIGTLETVTRNYTTTQCTNASNGTNGSCTLQTLSTTTQEVVYHGKSLRPGTNYVHLWSNDKPQDAWVDWQILIKSVPVKNAGLDTLADFDTHTKGWAVWGMGNITLNTSIVAYWTFDTDGRDSLGASNPNPVNGASITTTAKLGNASQTDQSVHSYWANASSNATWAANWWSGNQNITTCAWVRANYNASYMRLYTFGTDNSYQSLNSRYWNTTAWAQETYGLSALANFTPALTPNTWYYVCNQYRTDNTQLLWINGANVANTSWGSTMNFAPTKIRVARYDGGTDEWTGQIDELGVWKRQLGFRKR